MKFSVTVIIICFLYSIKNDNPNYFGLRISFYSLYIYPFSYN